MMIKKSILKTIILVAMILVFDCFQISLIICQKPSCSVSRKNRFLKRNKEVHVLQDKTEYKKCNLCKYMTKKYN